MKSCMISVSTTTTIPMRLLLAVLLSSSSLSSLSSPRASLLVVHSFAVVSPPSSRSRLQQPQQELVSSSVSSSLRLSLPAPATTLFSSFSNSLVEPRLADERDDDDDDDDADHHHHHKEPSIQHFTMPAGVEPHIQVIESHVDLQEFLAAGAEDDDRLVMIKFHAAWCKSCKRFGLHFHKLVSQKGDWMDRKTHQIVHHGQVRVASIEWTACTALCRSMGITRLPTVQFFNRHGEKVGSLAAGPSKFNKVQQALDHYLSLQSTELDFEADMERGKTLMDQQLLESGSVFNAPNPAAAKATTSSTRENAKKQLVMSSPASLFSKKVAPQQHEGSSDDDDDDQQHYNNNNSASAAAWWNVRSVLAQRRARRDASLREGGGGGGDYASP